jgi:hypothetical protein
MHRCLIRVVLLNWSICTFKCFQQCPIVAGKARSLPMKLSKLWQGVLTEGGGGDQYN